MKTKLGDIYSVSRYTKTGSGVFVGDYQTPEEAEAAMREHYRTTPKRGNFYYSINQETLEDYDGVIMRMMCFVLYGDNKPYHRRFTAAELGAEATT